MLFFQANLWYLFRDFTIIKCKRSHLPEGMKQMILKFSKIYCLQAEDQTKILEERLVLITKSRVRHIKSLSWSHFQTICTPMLKLFVELALHRCSAKPFWCLKYKSTFQISNSQHSDTLLRDQLHTIPQIFEDHQVKIQTFKKCWSQQISIVPGDLANQSWTWGKFNVGYNNNNVLMAAIFREGVPLTRKHRTTSCRYMKHFWVF